MTDSVFSSRTPFNIGGQHYALDEMENAPLASVGATRQGEIPEELTVPDYISEDVAEEWLRGYVAAAASDGRCPRCLSWNVKESRFRMLRGAEEWKRNCQDCSLLSTFTKRTKGRR